MAQFVLGAIGGYDDLFVDQLENQLRADGRNVEIVNAGTEAWDTAQQAAWLEANGADFQPDMVLVLPYENDLYWNSQAVYQTFDSALEKPRYNADGTLESRALTDNSAKPWHQSWAVTKWMRERDPAATNHRFQPAGASRPIDKELAPLLASAPAEVMGPIEDHTLGALRAIGRVAGELGAQVLVAPIPAATLYEDGWRDIYENGRGLSGLDWSGDRGVDLFLDYASRAGLDAVDVRPTLASARAAGDLRGRRRRPPRLVGRRRRRYRRVGRPKTTAGTGRGPESRRSHSVSLDTRLLMPAPGESSALSSGEWTASAKISAAC